MNCGSGLTLYVQACNRSVSVAGYGIGRYLAPPIQISRPVMGYGFTLLMYKKSPVNNLVVMAMPMATSSAGLDQIIFAHYE